MRSLFDETQAQLNQGYFYRKSLQNTLKNLKILVHLQKHLQFFSTRRVFPSGTKKREKLTLVSKRDAAVFVIRNVHHSKFKLCNSNLEDPSAILLLPFIRPNSDEKKSFSLIFQPVVLVEAAKWRKFPATKRFWVGKAISPWMLRSRKWLLMGFGLAEITQRLIGRKKAKFSWINFKSTRRTARSDLKLFSPSLSRSHSGFVFAAPRLQIRWTELAKIDILCNKLARMLLTN